MATKKSTTTITPEKAVESAKAELAEVRGRLREEEGILSEVRSDFEDMQADIDDGMSADFDEYQSAKTRLAFHESVVSGLRNRVTKLRQSIPSLDTELAEALAPVVSALLHHIQVKPSSRVALPQPADVDLTAGVAAYVVQDAPTKATRYGALAGSVEVVMFRASELYRGIEREAVAKWRDKAHAATGVKLDPNLNRVTSHTAGDVIVDRVSIKVFEAVSLSGPVLGEPFGDEHARKVAKVIAGEVRVGIQSSRRGYPTGEERNRAVGVSSARIQSSDIDADGTRRTAIEVRLQAGVDDAKRMAAPVSVEVDKVVRDLRNFIAGTNDDGTSGLIERAEMKHCNASVERSGLYNIVIDAVVASRDA